MRAFTFFVTVLMTVQTALASEETTVDQRWSGALEHRYKTKDVGSTIDPHRYNQAQLVYLTRVIKDIDDDRINSETSYVNVLTAKNLAFYMRARDVARQMFDEGTSPFDGNERGPMITGGPRDPLFLVQTGGDIAIDTEEDTNWRLIRLSFEFVGLYGRFRNAGYSHDVTQEALNRFEARNLQLIADSKPGEEKRSANEVVKNESSTNVDDEPSGSVSISEPLYAALTFELESKRLKYQRKMPRFIESDGLGAGGLDVKVRIIPHDGVAMRISRFNFLFCKAGKVNPYDRSKCDGWYAMRNGDSPSLSGNYEVFVSWPSGQKLHTNVSVDEQQTLTFTAPK